MNISAWLRDKLDRLFARPTPPPPPPPAASTPDPEALERVRVGKNYRLNRRRQVPVIPYTPGEEARSRQLELLWPGTAGVFYAAPGSALATDLKRLADGDTTAETRIITAIMDETRTRQPIPLDQAAEQLLAAPSFAEVRHMGQTLADNLFLPDGVSCCPVALPYNGGELAPEGLEVVEYLDPDHPEPLEVFAFARKPEDLSEAELAALAGLSDQDRSLNLGTALCWGATAVTLAIAVCAATGICCPHTDLRNRGWEDPPPGGPDGPGGPGIPGTPDVPPRPPRNPGWTDPPRPFPGLEPDLPPMPGTPQLDPRLTARNLLQRRRALLRH